MDFYLIIMYLLFGLAAIDLVVGVSNDAVNFLNSAVGSKVASFKTIMLIASIGILVGASFSSGMMEVARKGVFNPGFFTFELIMYVFLAVMLTDVILLDIYNSLGLPTSTTVSIVFELLGAAFAIGLVYAYNQSESIGVGEFINFGSAAKIIAGIFLSILLAFTIGAVVQYVVRLAFTFNIQKGLKRYGALFSGLAITAITYYLIIKGVEGSAFKTYLEWMAQRSYLIIGVSLVFWTVLAWVLIRFTKFNPLKLIVLAGTFSLAMAFAGNDLVNFIGVAIAAKQSYFYWLDQGGTLELAQNLKMTFLNTSQPTESYILVGAGVVMAITLWLSPKAKKVTDTEVSLGKQGEGEELFKATNLSRALVKSGMDLSASIKGALPTKLRLTLESSFEKFQPDKAIDESDVPAFDLLRASVNLMVASILIAYATSLKLPLSTTYVSFMVAMGASLADRAWGKDSAVYRVAGVINVIVGWLLTAFIAFISAALLALVIYFGGMVSIALLTLMALVVLVRSHVSFRSRAKEKKADQQMFAKPIDLHNVLDESKINAAKDLENVRKFVSLSLKSMVGMNRDIMVRSNRELEKMALKSASLQTKIIRYIKKMEHGQLDAGRLYILVFDLMQDLNQSATLISRVSTEHLVNYHEMPEREYMDILMDLDTRMDRYLRTIRRSIENLDFSSFNMIMNEKQRNIDFINEKIDRQILHLQDGEVSTKKGLLQTRILLESKDIIEISCKILKVYVEYAQESKSE